MVDLSSTTEPPSEPDQVSLLMDAYLDASELLTASFLNHFSLSPSGEGVIQLLYLSLVSATEALLAVAGLEVPTC